MTLKYDRIDELLKEKGISRRQLARMLEISESTFTSAFIRNSRKSFSIEMASAIAGILGVELGEIAALETRPAAMGEIPETEVDYLQKMTALSEGVFRLREGNEAKLRMRDIMDQLTPEGQKKALELAALLLHVPEYRRGEKNNGQS